MAHPSPPLAWAECEHSQVDVLRAGLTASTTCAPLNGVTRCFAYWWELSSATGRASLRRGLSCVRGWGGHGPAGHLRGLHLTDLADRKVAARGSSHLPTVPTSAA